MNSTIGALHVVAAVVLGLLAGGSTLAAGLSAVGGSWIAAAGWLTLSYAFSLGAAWLVLKVLASARDSRQTVQNSSRTSPVAPAANDSPQN